MKLLVFTQIVDEKDTGLGFFTRWIDLLSKKFDLVTVICLKKGEYHFSDNVRVFSLGKEEGVSRIGYLRRFYSLIIRERKEYDAVFVHMNQEYVLLGGIFWKLTGKRIVLWYNHTIGTYLTRIAYSLCDAVLYTSTFSYGAVRKIKQGKRMGAGIDVNYFNPSLSAISPVPSFLFLGRISPVKKVEEFASALVLLHSKGFNFNATICGDLGSPNDQRYFERVVKILEPLAAEGIVKIIPGVSHEKTKDLYLEHTFYINLTQTGSYDKTVLEAMALRRYVIALNKSFNVILPQKALIQEPLSPQGVVSALEYAMNLSHDQIVLQGDLNRAYVVKNHSLEALIDSLIRILEK